MGSPPAAYSWSTYFRSASWEHLGKFLSARQADFSGCSFSYSLSDASWQALSVRQAACVGAIVNVFKASRQSPSVRLPVGVWCFCTISRQGSQPLLAGGWLPKFSVVACWPGLTAVDAAAIRIATSYPFCFLGCPGWLLSLARPAAALRWAPLATTAWLPYPFLSFVVVVSLLVSFYCRWSWIFASPPPASLSRRHTPSRIKTVASQTSPWIGVPTAGWASVHRGKGGGGRRVMARLSVVSSVRLSRWFLCCVFFGLFVCCRRHRVFTVVGL